MKSVRLPASFARSVSSSFIPLIFVFEKFLKRRVAFLAGERK
jgi:hypothetical protein